MSDRVRLTISVTPETQEVFQRMADAAGVSLGRCMGDWLADTIEGAQFVTQKMVEARQRPRLVMREMQSFVRGLQDEIDQVLEESRSGQARAAATLSTEAEDTPAPAGRRGAQARGHQEPPSSNTGVNPPRRRAKP